MRGFLLLGGLVVLASCETTTPGPVAEHDPDQLMLAGPSALPEPPAVDHDITRFEDTTWNTPYIPAHRTTRDGRIGLSFSGGTQPKLHVLAPEQLTGGILQSGNGEPLTLGAPYLLQAADVYDAALGPLATKFDMVTICDDQPQIPDVPLPGPTSPVRDPYPCGVGDVDDCYDFTIIGVMQDQDPATPPQTQLWGREVTVRVTSPKMAQAPTEATIADVTFGAVAVHTYAPGTVRGMWEPIVTEDGRLFVTRLSYAYDLTWFDDAGNPQIGRYDSVYSYNETGTPCDVTEWHDDNLHPLSHAYFDSRLQGRYGIAEYPMRDGEGNLLADGEPVRSSYPWIDRKGANFFFTTHGTNLHYIDASNTSVVKTRYPVRCLPNQPSCSLTVTPTDLRDQVIEATWNYQGVAVTGAWTHGRTVLLDGMLNSVDYNLYSTLDKWREVQLYADETSTGGDDGWIEMGNGRCKGGSRPPGHVGNCNVIDSLENLFNYDPDMVPQTPRDVVWFMSNGRSTDEVAFDDYLDLDMLVFSDMNASLTNEPPSVYSAYAWNTSSTSTPVVGPRLHIHDGFEVVRNRVEGAGFQEELRFQNAATSPFLQLPPAGRAYATEGRIRVEPGALGGIHGKGAWLNGKAGILYDIPTQPNLDRDWFVSLFVDVRLNEDHPFGELLRFPDGSGVGFLDANTLVFAGANGQVLSISLPDTVWYKARAYNHLGFALRKGGTTVDVYVNGFLFDTLQDPLPIHEIRPGHFAVGMYASTVGFRGWIDELKVIGRVPQPGTICNHARGYIAGIDPAVSDAWSMRAVAYPRGHQEITTFLQSHGKPSYTHYACVHDYTTEQALPPATLHPRLTRDLRMPEGPLQWNVWRPDSRNNVFCLECHDGALGGGLGMTALAPHPNGALLFEDRRRQPMMSPPWAGGTFPAEYFGPGLLPYPLTLPDTGYPFYDYFVFP